MRRNGRPDLGRKAVVVAVAGGGKQIVAAEAAVVFDYFYSPCK